VLSRPDRVLLLTVAIAVLHNLNVETSYAM